MLASMVKKQFSEIVAVNQALTHDLDASRRIISELSREREALHAELINLRPGNPTRSKREFDMQTAELARQQNVIKQLRREREVMLRDLRATKEQMHSAERRLGEMRQERDEVSVELEESSATMHAIRDGLNEVFPTAR